MGNEENKTLYDIYRGILCNNQSFQLGKQAQVEYRFDCPEYAELKEKYPHIKRIYVRAEFPYIDDSYRNYLLERFEDTYYPEKMIDAGKAAYIERNYEMINKSKYCIVFYDENYVPPKRKHSRKDLIEYQPQSGTKLAYEYAVKKCVVINTKK